MNYLLDKKTKRKKFLYAISLIFVCLILFYFRSGIWNGLSYVSHKIFSPILIVGNKIGEKFNNARLLFISKNSLEKENENLKSELNQKELQMLNYSSLLAENIGLKEILGRANKKAPGVLAVILGRQNQNLYDTFIIDAGIDEGIEIGNIVFALGDIPIGRIDSVYEKSAKVVLFSNAGERIQAIISGKDTFVEIVGRGGGNFETIMPRDLTLIKGDQAVLPGIAPYVLGVVETVISDPRDPFVKALLTSPVNMREVKFVEVKK